MKAGCITDHGYVRIVIHRVEYYGHILAWFYMTGELPKFLIDHKNRIRSDNSWDNLRESTYSQNSSNSNLDKRNTSGARGVFYNKRRDTWFVQLTMGGQRTYLGSFKNKEDAVEVAQKARDDHFGAFST